MPIAVYDPLFTQRVVVSFNTGPGKHSKGTTPVDKKALRIKKKRKRKNK